MSTPGLSRPHQTFSQPQKVDMNPYRGYACTGRGACLHPPRHLFQDEVCTFALMRQCLLLAGPAKSEAEWVTSETRRWGALDVPSAPDGCAGRAAADRENIVRHRWCPSSPARNLRWG